MRVELTYFKPSGKYYGEGTYATARQFMHQIFAEVQEFMYVGALPGLGHGARYDTLVQVPDHPHNHPALIHAPVESEHDERCPAHPSANVVLCLCDPNFI